MDIEWIKFAFQIGAPLFVGVVGVLGAYYALRGKLDRHEDRLHRLENMENAALELRLSNVEDKLRMEKFEEFWRWQTTVNNRLDMLEKKR